MTDVIIEAAARALANATEWSSFWDGHDARQLARAVLAAVTPLIEAAALERKITTAMLLAALQTAEHHPEAYVDELEPGCFVIDGKFDLDATARRLSEMLRLRPHK